MIEKIQSSPLFNVRRAILTYALAFVFSLVDIYLIHLQDINTPEELLIETLIHGTGFYLAFTFIALVNNDAWPDSL